MSAKVFSSGRKGAYGTGTTASMGKKSGNMAGHGVKVTASAGKSTGMTGKGDSSSCAPMGGKGGKSC